MLNKLLIILIYVISIYAYELPKVEINSDKRPEIILFNATSIIVEGNPSYKIKWKTVNATDVLLTYIGKVKLSGSITVTADEYNRGPITITASSKGSSHSDTQTINMNKKSEDAPVVIFKEKEQKVESYHNYNTMPFPRRYNRPYRRPYY